MFVPFVMIFVAWKRAGAAARVFGVLWAVLALAYWVGLATAPASRARPVASASAETVTAKTHAHGAAHPRRNASPPKKLPTPAQKAAIRAKDDAAVLKTLESYVPMGQQVQVANGVYVSVVNISRGEDYPWPGGVGLRYQWDVEVQAINDSPNTYQLEDAQFGLVETPGPGQRAAIYMPDSRAETATTGNYSFPTVTLSPNETFSGWIVYKVPSSLLVRGLLREHYNLEMTWGPGGPVTDFSFLM